MAGPGNRSASISALQAISNPGSVANIAAPVLPAESLPISAQVDSAITGAMRGPGPRRAAAPVVGGGPGREVSEAAPEMDFGEDFMGDYMGGLQQPARSGMPGAFNPMAGMPGSMGMPGPAGMPGGSQGTTAYGGSSGPMVPQEIKGNLPAIRDWRKSGLPFDQWMQTLGASPWF